MTEKLRLGIVGAGAVVSGYHMPVLAALDDRVEVVWITDLDADRAKGIARTFGISKVATTAAEAPDVDVVLLATPVSTRLDLIGVAARRRWHAFCEKPFAATVEEHERILELMEKADRRSGIGLVRRFYKSTETARDLVAAEILGPVEAVLAGEGLRARKFGRGDWFQSDPKQSGGGVFAETGSHLIDQVFAICAVTRAELRQCKQERVNGLEMDTRALATITLPNGNAVPVTFGVSRMHDLFNGIVIRCRNGEIRLGLGPEDGVDLYDRSGSLKLGTLPGAAKPGIYPAMRGEWVHFLKACRDSSMPVDTGLTTTKFISQAYARATVTGRTTVEREAVQ